jgi:hypothetical protein
MICARYSVRCAGCCVAARSPHTGRQLDPSGISLFVVGAN